MRSIWAVAKNTVKQALRMKVAVIFSILLLVTLPAMAVSITGDGTLKGRLQTFVSYSLSLISLLLSLLTIIVSIYSFTSDMEHKQIYTVLTKPIRRFQLIFGKLLGVILLDAGLLILFSGIIYFTAIDMPKFSQADFPEFTRAQTEFFTARAGLTPAEIDVTDEVLKNYNDLKAKNQLPPAVLSSKTAYDKFIAKLTKERKRNKRSIASGGELRWDFHNIKPIDPNQNLFIRFKYDVSANPPDLKVTGKWLIGDVRQLGSKIRTPVYTFERRDLVRTFHEIEVPANAIAEDNYLAIVFYNDPRLNNTVVIFPSDDGLQLFYKADTFTNNFIKAVGLILCRLIFLACLGILTSTFLSFPVAILLCLVVFFAANINGFIVESFDSLSENLSRVYHFTIRPIVRLLPQFDKFNPAKFMVAARLISWLLLAEVLGIMVCIKAGLLLVFSLLIFSFREIAKIIV